MFKCITILLKNLGFTVHSEIYIAYLLVHTNWYQPFVFQFVIQTVKDQDI